MPAPERYAVIGHPIAHSLSPLIHTLFAQQTEQPLTYVALDIRPEQLCSSVREFFAAGGSGLNVTIPHKQAVIAALDQLSARAERAGAVNTILRQPDQTLWGDNTDGIGLVRDLTQNLHLTLAGHRVLLLGAGGAARGVLGPLLEQGPREIMIVNRTLERARELADVWAESRAVRVARLSDPIASDFDLIINATPPSADEPSLAPATLAARTVCYDMVYGRESGFGRWARRSGAVRLHDGLGMLVEQAAESFALWRGLRPRTAPVLAALRAPRAGAPSTTGAPSAHH